MSNMALEILDSDPFALHVSGTSRHRIMLFVRVWGMFPTSGWTNPQLVSRAPRPGSQPPAADSFAELDFCADAPTQGSIVFDALTPMLAEAVVELPQIVHGVRIHSRNGFLEKVVRFATGSPDEPGPEGDDFIPIPWLVAGGGVDLGG